MSAKPLQPTFTNTDAMRTMIEASDSTLSADHQMTEATSDSSIEKMPSASTSCPDRISAFNVDVAANAEPSAVSETESQTHESADAFDGDGIMAEVNIAVALGPDESVDMDEDTPASRFNDLQSSVKGKGVRQSEPPESHCPAMDGIKVHKRASSAPAGNIAASTSLSSLVRPSSYEPDPGTLAQASTSEEAEVMDQAHHGDLSRPMIATHTASCETSTSNDLVTLTTSYPSDDSATGKQDKGVLALAAPKPSQDVTTDPPWWKAICKEFPNLKYTAPRCRVPNLHDDGKEPRIPVVALMAMAILASPKRLCSIEEMWGWITRRYAWYRQDVWQLMNRWSYTKDPTQRLHPTQIALSTQSRMNALCKGIQDEVQKQSSMYAPLIAPHPRRNSTDYTVPKGQEHWIFARWNIASARSNVNFMELPTEVRLQVYSHLLTFPAKQWVHVHDNGSLHIGPRGRVKYALHSKKLLLAILATNRRIRAEAAECFYRHNRFSFVGHYAMRTLYKFLHTIRPVCRDQIAVVNIFYNIRGKRTEYSSAFKKLGASRFLKDFHIHIDEESLFECHKEYKSVAEFPGFEQLRRIRGLGSKGLHIYGRASKTRSFLRPMKNPRQDPDAKDKAKDKNRRKPNTRATGQKLKANMMGSSSSRKRKAEEDPEYVETTKKSRKRALSSQVVLHTRTRLKSHSYGDTIDLTDTTDEDEPVLQPWAS